VCRDCVKLEHDNPEIVVYDLRMHLEALPTNLAGLYHLFESCYNGIQWQRSSRSLLEINLLLYYVLGKSRKFNDVFFWRYQDVTGSWNEWVTVSEKEKERE